MKDLLTISLREPLPGEIRRIGSELLTDARARLAGIRSDPETAVHETRKRLKELRSLLRLVRGELGERVYHTENIIVRNAARSLSEVRDRAVIIELLNDLADDRRARGIVNGLMGAKARLAEEYAERLEFLQRDAQIAETGRILLDAQARMATWPLRRFHFDALKPGLERVYRGGHAGMRQARENPSDEHLHDWRRRVKDLWYHTRMLAEVWPPVMTGLAESLHELSDLLGSDHDLAVLAGAVRCHDITVPEHVRPELERLIAQRRRRYRNEIWLLGVRIYAESPLRFVHRMETYWRAGTRLM